MTVLKEKHAVRPAGPSGKRQLSSRGPQSQTFEEIARQQGVGPIEDPSELVGGWPGDIDDGFEEALLAWRQQRLSTQV